MIYFLSGSGVGVGMTTLLTSVIGTKGTGFGWGVGRTIMLGLVCVWQ